MHKMRWITGLAALPFLVWLLSWGGPVWFAVVVAAISVLGVHEAFRLLFPGTAHAGTGADPDAAVLERPLRLLAYGAGPLLIYGAYRSPPLILVFLALNLMA
ncbi:MAG: hypothetical protein JRJ54_01360, partial [Deltaproteobacteria bacterium]|nr:hypothetical protein [Deltaproteobacteria bacterium]